MNTQKSEKKATGLACIDLDGTLTNNRSSWEFIFQSLDLWDTIGVKNLEMFLNSEIDYEEFASRDVAAWKGLEEEEYLKILASIPMNNGIKDLVDFFISKDLDPTLSQLAFTVLPNFPAKDTVAMVFTGMK